MSSAAVVLVAMSVAGATDAQAPAGVSAKPQQSIIDLGHGGGWPFGIPVVVCSFTPGGTLNCVIRWPA